MRISRACSTSLIALSLVAACPSGHALSLASVLHLHSHLSATSGAKAELHLHNPNYDFRDVQVDGRVYTVSSKRNLVIYAPVGTPVYAASGMFRKHPKGALLVQVEAGRNVVDLD